MKKKQKSIKFKAAITRKEDNLLSLKEHELVRMQLKVHGLEVIENQLRNSLVICTDLQGLIKDDIIEAQKTQKKNSNKSVNNQY